MKNPDTRKRTDSDPIAEFVTNVLRNCTPLGDRLHEIADELQKGGNRMRITARGIGRVELLRMGVDADANGPAVDRIVEAARREAQRDAMDAVLLALGLIAPATPEGGVDRPVPP